MAIITISREIAALGDEAAGELVKLLNYRLIDEATIDQRLVSYGFTERKIKKYYERKRGFWTSSSQDRYDYPHYLKTAMYEEAQKGDCIFVGRSAMSIFHDVPGIITVLIVAPMHIRIGRAKSYFNCDEKLARQLIDRSDHDRTGFHRYYFDINWTSAVNYMLVLNTGRIDSATVAAIIGEFKKLTITPEDESKCKDKLDDLRLGQKVINYIRYKKKLPIQSLQIACTKGHVLLHGAANSQTTVEAAVEAAHVVDGVKTVREEIRIADYVTGYP